MWFSIITRIHIFLLNLGFTKTYKRILGVIFSLSFHLTILLMCFDPFQKHIQDLFEYLRNKLESNEVQCYKFCVLLPYELQYDIYLLQQRID